MMSFSKDFEKYLKSKKINSEYVNRYKSSISLNIEDISNSNIFDKLLNERIIFLGEIDDYSAELTKANILYLDSISDDDISLYINSGGGSVYSGLGLLDVMDYVNCDISTINTGLAASMAAVILCSGEKGKRKSLKRSRTMIHQPIGGGWIQQASDIEIEAREINSLKT
jgi:ATP-dependent Clp protease protease subunit